MEEPLPKLKHIESGVVIEINQSPVSTFMYYFSNCNKCKIFTINNSMSKPLFGYREQSKDFLPEKLLGRM